MDRTDEVDVQRKMTDWTVEEQGRGEEAISGRGPLQAQHRLLGDEVHQASELELKENVWFTTAMVHFENECPEQSTLHLQHEAVVDILDDEEDVQQEEHHADGVEGGQADGGDLRQANKVL